MNKISEVCSFKKVCLCSSCLNDKCSNKSCDDCKENEKAFVPNGKCPRYMNQS